MAGDPFDRENPEGVFPTLRGLELRLGLPEGFCEQLLHEDDWSLLLKLSALVETALTEALAKALARPALEEPFSYVPLGDSHHGKAQFAHALGLLTKKDRTAVLHLARLRNHCAHRVREVSFDLKQHLANDLDEEKDFLRDFADYLATYSATTERERAKTVAKENPKRAVWATGLLIVATLATQTQRAKAAGEVEKEHQELSTLVRKFAHLIVADTPLPLRTGAELKRLIPPPRETL